ncbi:MAG: hypothetical protein R6V01_05360 [Thermoplasmatota archaeon]
MKKKLSAGNIRSFNDLLQIKQELDSNTLSDISIEGNVHVFPSRVYEVNSREDLENTISRINIYSSPYASLSGNIVLKKQLEH